MSWDGLLFFDDTEIINTTRTEAYAARASWFYPAFKNEVIPTLLGQDPYSTPVFDPAPWYDADDPRSGNFWGVYPISIDGLDDSSRGSTVTEFTTDGGSPGRLRHGTKAVVIQAMLLGSDDDACDYGAAWLRRALLGALCSSQLVTTNSFGKQLGFLSASPVLPDGVDLIDPTTDGVGYVDGGFPWDIAPEPVEVDAVLRDYQRFWRNVVFNAGPIVQRKTNMSGCGGAMWIVQFTGVAGSAYTFGAEKGLVQGYLDPDVENPWVPGAIQGFYTTEPYLFTEVECGTDLWAPIYDPLCNAMVEPPTPPSVPIGCYTPPETWQRVKLAIPELNIPLWGMVAPTITVHSEEGLRNLRVRFYPDPDGDFDPEENPCDYIGDFVLSYIPVGGTLVFDGPGEEIYVIDSLGHRRRADSLVFANDSTPVRWPVLSCGYGYVVTFDMLEDEAVPVIDLSLTPRNY
jgi:hypothetical protein